MEGIGVDQGRPQNLRERERIKPRFHPYVDGTVTKEFDVIEKLRN